MFEDDEDTDCWQCNETDADAPWGYPHCCGCGADGSSERPDCTCTDR